MFRTNVWINYVLRWKKSYKREFLIFWVHVNGIILVGTTCFLFLRFVHMKLPQARSEYFQHMILPMILQGHHQDAVVGGRSSEA